MVAEETWRAMCLPLLGCHFVLVTLEGGVSASPLGEVRAGNSLPCCHCTNKMNNCYQDRL